jgi:hypothetical protein
LTRCKEEFFTGSENLFASGADLKEITSFKPLQVLELAKLGQDLMRKIRLRNSISAINGLCYRGASVLVLSCKKKNCFKGKSSCFSVKRQGDCLILSTLKYIAGGGR